MLDSCLFAENEDAYALLFGYDNAKFTIRHTTIIKNGLISPIGYFNINGFKDFNKNYPNDTMVVIDKIEMFNNNMNFVQRHKGSVLCRNSTFSLESGNAIYTSGEEPNNTHIENCVFTGTPVNYMIYNTNNTLKIKDCNFDGENKTYNSGIVSSRGSVFLMNTTFKNFSYFILNFSPEKKNDVIFMEKCLFENNLHSLFNISHEAFTLNATSFTNNRFLDGNYPLFSFAGSKIQMKNCGFNNNSVNINIPLIDTHSADSTFIDSCVFLDNQTKNYSLLNVIAKQYMQVSNTKFYTNFSEYNYMPSGQVYHVTGGTLRSSGNLYLGNSSNGEKSAGVAYTEGNVKFINDVFDGNSGDTAGVILNSGNLVMANCNIVNHNNTALRGVKNQGIESKATVYNSIFWDNKAGNFALTSGSTIVFSNCFSNDKLPGTANIEGIDPPLGPNYAPINISLTDKGILLHDTLKMPSKDFSGQPRIVNIIDIGAVESPLLSSINFNAPIKPFKIYPNPVNENFAFIDSDKAIEKVEIYSGNGGILNSIILKSYAKLDLSNFKNGLYIFKIYSEDSIFSEKIVINR